MRFFIIDMASGAISMTDSEHSAMQSLRIAETVVIDAELCDRITLGDRDAIPQLWAISTEDR